MDGQAPRIGVRERAGPSKKDVEDARARRISDRLADAIAEGAGVEASAVVGSDHEDFRRDESLLERDRTRMHGTALAKILADAEEERVRSLLPRGRR